MSKKRISTTTPQADVPYDPDDRKAVMDYWKGAVAHHGLAELRAKRGRPPKAPGERKAQIALRVDAEVLAWFKAKGKGWQTRMNTALRRYRDADRKAAR